MSDPSVSMTSHRPYLLRALAEWIADNDMTPHLLVDATLPGVQVPPSVVKEGKVVLNIAQRAVVRLQIDNDSVSFSARFGGVSYPVMVPISAVLAIYARETGQGMALPDDIGTSQQAGGNGNGNGNGNDDEPPSPDSPAPGDAPPTGKRPHLRVVK